MNDKEKKAEEDKAKMDRMKHYMQYSGLGFQVVAMIVLGAFFGKWLDKKMLNEFPTMTLILTFLSVFLSMYYLYKKVNSGK